MKYSKQNFKRGQILKAEHLNCIEDALCKGQLDVNGSEIFNDYEGNETNIPFAHISGHNNKAIVKCFKIVGFPGDYENQDTFTIELDSVEGIDVGMSWNIFTPSGDSYKKWVYTVLAVDKSANTITWSDPTIPSTVYRSVRELIAAGLTVSTGATFFNTFICNGGSIGSHEIEDLDNACFTITMTGEDNIGYLGAFVSGKGCKGLGFCAYVSGDRCEVIADRGAAFNYKTTAGSEAFAINLQTQALGDGSFSQGLKSKALAKYSSSFGQGTETHCTNGMSRGQYNTIDKEGKYLDMVGNGEDANNRSNAYTLDKEGNAYFAGNIRVKNVYFNDEEDSGTLWRFKGPIDSLPVEGVRTGDTFKTISDVSLSVKQYRIGALAGRKYKSEEGVILSDTWTAESYDQGGTYRNNMVHYENLIKILDGGYEGFNICDGSSTIYSADVTFKKPRKLFVYVDHRDGTTPFTLEAEVTGVKVDTTERYIKFYGTWINDQNIETNYQIPGASFQYFRTDNVYHNASELYGKLDQFVSGGLIHITTFTKGSLVFRTESDGWV